MFAMAIYSNYGLLMCYVLINIFHRTCPVNNCPNIHIFFEFNVKYIYAGFFCAFSKKLRVKKTQVFQKTRVIFDKNSGFQIFLANLLMSP